MKILLVNQNKMVGKLFENIAKKLDLELVAEEHAEEILPALDESKECFFFADDTAVDGEEYERLKPHLDGVPLSGLLLRKGIEEFGEFTHYIKKPFLPTDILHILQRNMGPSTPATCPSLPQDLGAVSSGSDVDFFKDIDSNLSQLEGLLDTKNLESPSLDEINAKEEPKQEEPQFEVQKEPITSQKEAKTEVEQKEEVETEEVKPKSPKEEEVQETTPLAQEAHDPLALNLDDLLPIDDSEDETHAGLEHDEMLEDLAQEDSPKAQDLMDGMQNIDELMQSAGHEIEQTKEPELQTPKEPDAPTASTDQDPMDILGGLETLEATQENTPTPQEPKVEATIQEVQSPNEALEDAQTLELEGLEGLDDLEPQETKEQTPSTKETPKEAKLEQKSTELEIQDQETPQVAQQALQTGKDLDKLGLEDLEGLDDLEQKPKIKEATEPQSTEVQGQEAQEIQEARVSELEGLGGLELEPQEDITPTKAEQKPTELETQAPQEPTEQEPQAQKGAQELEPQNVENALKGLELEEGTKTQDTPKESQESALEGAELEPQEDIGGLEAQELAEQPPIKGAQKAGVDLEKDPQEYEHIEDIPEPVMSSVVDGTPPPQAISPETPKEQTPKTPKELEIPQELEAQSPEALKEQVTAGPKEQEGAPTTELKAVPLHLDLNLQDLLKDLPIDPKLLEGKTLKIQVNLVDKDA
ncbi:hypothetical protein [Helicobacter heilmannii]|uniref:hypothetical protein n=1 Tax=Helicobacter heilmannii TaxID=35817 RepID=UPI000CF1B7B7|nr:hypothetical protein [Helicobacter heilmannii]